MNEGLTEIAPQHVAEPTDELLRNRVVITELLAHFGNIFRLDVGRIDHPRQGVPRH
ncbi:hypothetical protein D3C87_2038540 [compost metagenome]